MVDEMSPDMKNSHFLLLLIAGSITAGIGFFIRPEYHAFEKYLILGVSALILLLFYSLSFMDVLKNENLNQQRRIFWTIVIICVPLIGNVLYLIINDAINRPQQPKYSLDF